MKVKKMLVIATIFLFVFTATYPLTLAETKKLDVGQVQISQTSNRDTNQHKVLGEMGTTTWCPYCPSMGYWLTKVTGDFVYVALVADKNGYADSRCSQLGLTGYPTTFFDGGYRNVKGGQSNVNNLQNAYDQCQARTVKDLTVTAGASLNENTDQIEVITFIDNNEGSAFNGQLRIYVCEKESRWNDYDGDPYENAFLGWATNAPISISAQGSISVEGNFNYPDMTVDNIMLVVAVFDSTNDYVQQTITITPGNDEDGGGIDFIPPVVSIKYPEQDDIVRGIVNITGVAHHPRGDGNLKWTVVKIDDGEWIDAEGTSEWKHTWDTTTVEEGEHTIQAITSDGTLQSGMKMITVIVNNHINYPPDTPPVPTGPLTGKAGMIYSFTSSTTDPNENNIRYGWDINADNEVDIWSDYVSSGEEVNITMSWGEAGTYAIKVKAEDEAGNASDFSDHLTIEVTGVNEAPTDITIAGPSKGAPETPYKYTATATDPEGTDIWYYFDWGDGKTSGWRGPYSSGESIEIGHTWSARGRIEIKVMVKDIHDQESDWETMQIRMAKHKDPIVSFPDWIIPILKDRFPMLEVLI